VLVALVVAAAPDGGTLPVIYGGCPEASDAGAAVELDGGTWLLPPPRGPRLACRLAACESALVARDTPLPAFSGAAVALAVAMGLVGLLVGAWGGWQLARLVAGL